MSRITNELISATLSFARNIENNTKPAVPGAKEKTVDELRQTIEQAAKQFRIKLSDIQRMKD